MGQAQGLDPVGEGARVAMLPPLFQDSNGTPRRTQSPPAGQDMVKVQSEHAGRGSEPEGTCIGLGFSRGGYLCRAAPQTDDTAAYRPVPNTDILVRLQPAGHSTTTSSSSRSDPRVSHATGSASDRPRPHQRGFWLMVKRFTPVRIK